jgi:hypothetical protein
VAHHRHAADPLALKPAAKLSHCYIVAGGKSSSGRVEVHALGTREALPMVWSCPRRCAQSKPWEPSPHTIEVRAVARLGKQGRLVAAMLASADSVYSYPTASDRPWFWRDPLLARLRAAAAPSAWFRSPSLR